MPHLVHNARTNPLRVDPTRTTLVRRQFQAEILRRIRLLKRDVWEFIVTLDALGLVERVQVPVMRLEARKSTIPLEIRPSLNALILNVQPREYAFRTSTGKIAAFRQWLSEQVEARIMSPRKGEDPNKPWTYKYIESAYKKGQVNAYIAARKLDAVMDEGFFNKSQEAFLKSSFNQPETLAKVELLATRSFEGMRGVTEEMKSQMNRILAQGMVDGSGVREVAREMFSSIDGITRRRAQLIARTEIIHAHAEGQLDSFQELGVEELGVLAEWATAMDERVCPRCASLEGKHFTIKEARGKIPAHPNCRCTFIPFVPIGKAKPNRVKKSDLLKKKRK